jgi:two-component system LytT family response regulator
MADAPTHVPWRVVVADDEPLARLRLRTLLARDARFAVVAESEDGARTLEALAAHRPDVLFLDVRMPALDGVAVAEALAAEAAAGRPVPAVVFVTAYDVHAARAFDLDAVDYLVKPVDVDRFDRAVGRLAARLARARDGAAGGVVGDAAGVEPAAALRAALEALAALRPAARRPDRLAVRDARGVTFIAVADVDRLEADGNYVAVWASGRRRLLRESLRALEAKLDPERFVRVHRSAIVAVDRIRRLEPCGHGEYDITLADGATLTSSRTYGARLQALMR